MVYSFNDIRCKEIINVRNGCRIGFDAGGSDRKVSAVINGEAVYSEEVVWFPKINSDPDYHYAGIVAALKSAAEHMPRVDAVGVSSAGIYINNRTMNASLFLKVPKEQFDAKVKDIYIRAITDTFGDVPYSVVNDGDVIAKGTQLQDGALNPHDVLRIRGASAVHNYLIQEVLKVYRQQGVDINDKHIEVIVRQMMRKVRVEDANDAEGLLSGAMADVMEVEDANAAVRARIATGEKREDGEELQEATYTQLLMGITKASLATDSFLSAASFQETTKVLTEAAIKGKVDHLVGLKENVIIGKLIPAGAGLTAYRKLAEEMVPDVEAEEEAVENVYAVSVGPVEDEAPAQTEEPSDGDEA